MRIEAASRLKMQANNQDVLHFRSKDSFGNTHKISVGPQRSGNIRVWSVSPNGQVEALSNHMFNVMHRSGNEEKTKKLRDELIDAYKKSNGEPKTVERALQKTTNVPNWKFYRKS